MVALFASDGKTAVPRDEKWFVCVRVHGSLGMCVYVSAQNKNV